MATDSTQLLPPPVDLVDELGRFIAPERVLTRTLDRVAFASDASFYRLMPRAVVLASSVEEVQRLFALSRARGIPLSFRAAGTSLSGQSLSDGLLVEVARHWRSARVEDGGLRIRARPGMIGDHLNQLLRPFGRKIGPDPASIRACTLGGILANNSSGMCCGVEQNSYHTLRSLTFVLPSGTCIDTAAEDADTVLRAREPALHQGLLALRDEVRSRPGMVERIRAKYRMKNTTGYQLNAFVDFDRPIDIFAHLLVGSEGTLAFIAEAVMDTVPVLPHKSTGLLFFGDVHAACAAIGPFRDAGAQALELLDAASLRAAAGKPGMPTELGHLGAAPAALLCEFQTGDEAELPSLMAAAAALTRRLPLSVPGEFTRDPELQARFWRVREGLFPTVGGVRRSGTTVVIEDVCFPIPHLADAAVDLQRLFRAHGYDNAIIFGHAKDGNLHFVITQSFNDQAAVDQYARFIDDLVPLVVRKYDGALKAEHGTGRNMAPFVETEWGPEGAAIMRRLKMLVDPAGLLNPGVIVPTGPKAHLDHLKSLPSIEREADMCIECGFCEPVCPSRELTLTPRQRIVVRRELERQTSGTLAEELRRDYQYAGLDTCAGDGMCQTRCPVSIDTGALVKRFRAARHSSFARSAGLATARGAATAERLARAGLATGHALASVIGHRAVGALTGAARSVLGDDLVPRWTPDMPHAARALPRTTADGAQAIYFPACMLRMFGPVEGEPAHPTIPEALLALARRAAVPVHIPEDITGACCSTPWHSKGYVAGDEAMANATLERLWRWTGEGRLPVVVEGSSCTHGFREGRAALTPANQERFDRLRILDSVEFVHDTLLPRLRTERRLAAACIHPVCSVVEMGLTPKLVGIGRFVADEVVVPDRAGCCGFAGDRGFLHPELTRAATRPEAAEVSGRSFEAYLLSNHPCTIGMHRATGRPWQNFALVLEGLTRSMET
ncbi:MAG TPA: FAD-binding and (Fe-S)-binding domain-containing protein [Myxococcaceae bacterium]|nr:FAD-binding and (Fe-S)-binding domain-containing protein [Myxococcaceae bacterium]